MKPNTIITYSFVGLIATIILYLYLFAPIKRTEETNNISIDLQLDKRIIIQDGGNETQ